MLLLLITLTLSIKFYNKNNISKAEEIKTSGKNFKLEFSQKTINDLTLIDNDIPLIQFGTVNIATTDNTTTIENITIAEEVFDNIIYISIIYKYNNIQYTTDYEIEISINENNATLTPLLTNGTTLNDIFTTTQYWQIAYEQIEEETEINAYKIMSLFIVQQQQIIMLDTPTISINFNTISWQPIQYATYYSIYLNGVLIAQTQTTQWITIENGNYQVQAGTNIDGYSNSELSNTINQDAYNDIIGNGANFYTLFGAIIDSEIYLIKALTNYTIWGINFFNLFKLFITTCLIFIIIKFALKQKG